MKTAILLLGVSTLLPAESEQTRGIVPEEVIKARPKRKTQVATVLPKYQAVGPTTGKLEGDAAFRQVGVTIWLLRPARQDDNGARILVQDEGGAVEWVPERVSSTKRLHAGDRVRLTIESPGTGYLYVIDRERYATGQRGSPYLIFPTTRTRGGDNRVSAGKLIDIPAQTDRPNFFRLTQSRPDQVEEELTVLLATNPIAGLELGLRAMPLAAEVAEQWEKKWGTRTANVFELSGGDGKAWTKAEQEAAANSTRILNQEDPPPQTVFRVLPGADKESFLIKVRLRYSAE